MRELVAVRSLLVDGRIVKPGESFSLEDDDPRLETLGKLAEPAPKAKVKPSTG